MSEKLKPWEYGVIVAGGFIPVLLLIGARYDIPWLLWPAGVAFILMLGAGIYFDSNWK